MALCVQLALDPDSVYSLAASMQLEELCVLCASVELFKNNIKEPVK